MNQVLIQLPPLPVEQVNVLLEALSIAPLGMAKVRGVHDLIFSEAQLQIAEAAKPAAPPKRARKPAAQPPAG